MTAIEVDREKFGELERARHIFRNTLKSYPSLIQSYICLAHTFFWRETATTHYRFSKRGFLKSLIRHISASWWHEFFIRAVITGKRKFIIGG